MAIYVGKVNDSDIIEAEAKSAISWSKEVS